MTVKKMHKHNFFRRRIKKEYFKPMISIIILAWPIVLEMSLHTFVWIFDTGMVMRLGAHEATAVEYGALVIFNVLAILAALGIGANSLVARYIGACKPKQAAMVGGQALSLGLLLALLYFIISIYVGNLLFSWVIKDSITVVLAEKYFYTTLYSGGFAFLPWLIASGIIRGTGNTKTPMKIALIANLYNIIGDYVLIFGHFGFPAMGVQGAAFATGSAQLIGFILSAIYLFSSKNNIPFKLRCLLPLRRIEVEKLLRLSIPAGGEVLTHQGSMLVIASWITALGPVAFAANAAAIAAESISFMPGKAFALAATTLVGQRIGAELFREARDLGYWAAALGTLLMSAVGLIFFFFPYTIMALFDPPDPEVLRLGALCLQVMAIEQPFFALTLIIAGAMKGTGDTKTPFKVGLFSTLFIRLPLIYAVVYLFDLGIHFIWWASCLHYAVRAGLLLWLYRRKQWERVKPLPSELKIT